MGRPEKVYYPLEVEPYTPSHHFGGGKDDPRLRTKLKIASGLVERSVAMGIPFRAVVANAFYGEDRGFKRSLSLEGSGVGYVLALKKSHSWWHLEGTCGALWQAAQGAAGGGAPRSRGSGHEGGRHLPGRTPAGVVGAGGGGRTLR